MANLESASLAGPEEWLCHSHRTPEGEVTGEGVGADEAGAILDGDDHGIFDVFRVFHRTGADHSTCVNSTLGRIAEQVVGGILYLRDGTLPQNRVEGTDKTTGLVGALFRHQIEDLISDLAQALESYKLDLFAFPSTEQGLQALVTPPAGLSQVERYREGGYIRRLPKDPWGNPYQYRSPGAHGVIDVFSFGADGREGGEGKDADIGNWG